MAGVFFNGESFPEGVDLELLNKGVGYYFAKYEPEMARLETAK